MIHGINWVKTHRYCLVGLYLFVFLIGFFLLERFAPEPRYILHSVIDDWIPFCEWFVIPYFLWYAWVPVFLIFFMVTDKEAYLKLCFILFTGATLCLVIYAVWPNGLELRREIEADNFCADVVRFVRSIDPACNVCPSIHVSSTAAIHLVIRRSKAFRDSRRMKGLSWAVTIAICISTLFIKQHSVIDVFWGWVLSYVLYRAAYSKHIYYKI
ncbi:MAG: serine/threonine protein phosphatase [Lachnospiraceae bacterium]|nr:serine/threonine protein phosphatase [Lachnospiraceae bacterium]